MARYRERYGQEDHGLGDTARRHAEADYHDQFGTGGRTQNLPDDYGTGRDPQAFERRYRDEPYFEDRYGESESRVPGRGFRGRGPKDYMRTDERIREDVCERLWDADDVDASDVSVAVKDGVVTLSGNVEQRRTKHRIEDIVDDCGGVKDIRNDIRVQRRNEAAGSVRDASRRSGGSQRNEGMVQSTIEEMPPRSH